jgi:endonuclease YncB( thermonuclease family)
MTPHLTPKQLVLEVLQKLQPCGAVEIDFELRGRMRLGLLSSREWPKGAEAKDFLAQLEREGIAVERSGLWEYRPPAEVAAVVKERRLFE